MKTIISMFTLFLAILTYSIIAVTYLHTSIADTRDYTHKNFVSKDSFSLVLSSLVRIESRLNKVEIKECKNGK